MMVHTACRLPGAQRETPPPGSSACAGGVSVYIDPHKADSKFSKTSFPESFIPLSHYHGSQSRLYHGCEPYTYMVVPRFFENNILEEK